MDTDTRQAPKQEPVLYWYRKHEDARRRVKLKRFIRQNYPNLDVASLDDEILRIIANAIIDKGNYKGRL